MSRGFWGGLMVVSLLIAGASGYFLYSRIIAVSPVPVVAAVPKPVPVEPTPDVAPPAPAVVSSTATLVALTTSTTPTRHETAEERLDPSGKRKVLFSLNRPTAKSVFIIGDFNKWYRQPMKKNGKAWEFSTSLKPGRYEYLFVVDSKRMPDPSAKIVSNGKSVLVVKPASQD